MAGAATKVRRTPLRWAAKVLGRYDSEKRPLLSAWTLGAIAAIMLLAGVLGYVVPEVLSRIF